MTFKFKDLIISRRILFYVQASFNDSLESTAGIVGLDPGTVALTQDKVEGDYAVKVVASDAVSSSVSYSLTASDPFQVSKFRPKHLVEFKGKQLGGGEGGFHTDSRRLPEERNDHR